VGDKAWVEGGSHGIQTGHAADDMNVVFDPVSLPTTPTPAASWLAPFAWQQNVTISGTSYGYAFQASGDFKVNSLGGKIYVGPGVTVRLYVTGSASFSGQDRIDLMAGGSVLKIYMGGSFSTAGNAAINNYNQNAANFYLFGLPSCTSINLAGNASFTGVIYAPQAALSLGGGGNNTYEFIGFSVSKSVVMNNQFNFHYDENLKRIGLDVGGFIPPAGMVRAFRLRK
jgi:hypothetical protein